MKESESIVIAVHRRTSGRRRFNERNSGRRFTFTMFSLLFWTCWIGVLFAHLRLSYPAIVYHGYPPLASNKLIALFIGPLFALVPAIFGDSELRRKGITVGAFGFAIVYALAVINLSDARPSVGHFAGIWGIIRSLHIFILALAVMLYIPVVLALHFVDGVLGSLLRLVVSR